MVPSASAPPSSVTREAELAIVGAGPVGLYAAYYAGFRGLETILFETLPMFGGQISAFYPDTQIYDVAGFPAVSGRELVDRLVAQMSAFPIDTRLGEEVVAVERQASSFAIATRAASSAPSPAERTYRARAVLVTAGIGSFSPQRMTDPAIAHYEGRGLSYETPAPERVAGARVVVLGGSERAVDMAIALAAAAESVTLVHRRDRLPVSDQVRARLDASPVDFLPFHDLLAIAGADRVERVTLADRRDGTQQQRDAQLVVPCYGFHADASALGRFGARLDEGALAVDSRMASDLPGIYAAGDGATYPGKVRLLAADFGEACTAINNIAAAVIPGANLFPGYSSHRNGAPRRPR